ncbi:hypothetical protein GAO09_11150 [Rhizobiales bacterium RZME27]|uniref:SWIM-type domain-containing protein n=1 Tax=Endobacterium cereale TaxID=2663029 RepID=A0A6A8AAD6_9HYPH|nr:hypothetical protein [Endobacterium cereale]
MLPWKCSCNRWAYRPVSTSSDQIDQPPCRHRGAVENCRQIS